MNKITIIDGNSLLFRAYYATAFPGVEIMRSKDGTPTNAIFAFSNMINKIISDIKQGEALFVAFDAGKHNFRHDALQTYKANRKPAPEDLVIQFPIVREYLKAMGIFQFEEENFEGDDIAGTVAKLAEETGYEVHLFTSDRDFLQLVSKNTYVHILKQGLTNVVVMTPELVKETYGFEPHQIIDYKGLRGDSSDNLPGIPGIGEKTAVKLIQDYGSFDNIIANVENIKGKMKENIIKHAEIGRISRDLAIIKTDVELPFKIEDTIYKGYSFENINQFCQKYDLKSYINKVSAYWKIKEITNNDIVIKKVSKLPTLKSNHVGFALDFDNENYTNSEIYGLSFFDEDEVYYLSFSDFKNDKYAQDVLKDENILFDAYDFKAIKVNLALKGYEINGLGFDLLIATYLIDSTIKNNPDMVMNSHGIDLGMSEISLLEVGNYSKTSKIAFFSKALKDKVLKTLSDLKMLELYNTLELPLTIVLSEMEIEGFPVDVKMLDSFGEIYKERCDSLSKEIYSLAGEEFNLSSPKQIGEILYDKMSLPKPKKASTNVDVLKEIAHAHPIVNKILEYRKYFKLLSTYVQGMKKQVHMDGKIHAKFNQALTQTGRLSSSDPNLQNISIRDEESKLIRKAFYYENDYEILSLDYSQIELRVLSSLAKCEGLKEVFRNGLDIHAETAKKIFGLLQEPSEFQRRKAKTVNFGIVYGISDWGLADDLQIPVLEARQLIDNFYSIYPEIAVFFKDIINQASNDGFVSTILGRRRYLREIHDSNYQVREFAKRAAMNAPIQGTAADLIKLAMIKVNKILKENGYKTKMVLQIHDELIFKVPISEKEEIYPIIKNTMENAMKLDIPLEVDGGYGKDWYSAK